MAKAAADGQTVNIPSRRMNAMEGRSAVDEVPYWFGIRASRKSAWQIRQAAFNGDSQASG
jgi:hypothetical protein